MGVTHTFSSSEREKVEIISGLLQQAGYRLSRIRLQEGRFVVTVSLVGRIMIDEEYERIAGLVSHFGIEDWSTDHDE